MSRNPSPEEGGASDGRKPADGAPPEAGSPQNQWLALLNLGWVFLATMGLTVYGGTWLDERYGTAPLFILIGVFLGFGASGWYFYETVRKLGNGGPRKPHG
jgi:hypothetical protein